MPERRTAIGVALSGCAAAFLIAGAVLAAQSAGWGDPVVLSLLGIGAVCLLAALWLLRPTEPSAATPEWVHVDEHIRSSTWLLTALEDEDEPIQELRSMYGRWHHAVLYGLGAGWKGDFTHADPQARRDFVWTRKRDTEYAAVATELAWDLEKLRKIKSEMRQRETR